MVLKIKCSQCGQEIKLSDKLADKYREEEVTCKKCINFDILTKELQEELGIVKCFCCRRNINIGERVLYLDMKEDENIYCEYCIIFERTLPVDPMTGKIIEIEQ